MSPASERTLEQLAHALTPWEWSGRALAAGIVALAAFGVLIVVQRALVADSTLGWVITAVHALVVILAVPLLAVRAVRRWRELQPAD